MRSKIWRYVGTALALIAALCIVLIARAKWVIARSYSHVPRPEIAADTSAAGVARGEMLFQSLCMECHGGSDGRATGKKLDEVPEFLGTFYSANLAHPEHGVRRRSDGEIARVLRFGVLPDGRFSPAMSGFNVLGDSDVSAILGYMRSGADAFAPTGVEQPRSTLTLVGSVILTYVAGVSFDRPATGVRVPDKAVTKEYGRYMVQAMDCVGCHTDGFDSDKLNDPAAFAGGFEFTDPLGAKIWTKNITPDEETGIGKWSRDDFERALTRGVTPQGYLVRKPMPLFSRLDHTDVAAIHEYLSSVPKLHHPNRPGGQPLQKARAEDPPEVLFVNVGCASCHGKTGPYRQKIQGALGKSDQDVASWILDPQASKPGSIMPSFQNTLSRSQAEELARYVKVIAKSEGS